MQFVRHKIWVILITENSRRPQGVQFCTNYQVVFTVFAVCISGIPDIRYPDI